VNTQTLVGLGVLGLAVICFAISRRFKPMASEGENAGSLEVKLNGDMKSWRFGVMPGARDLGIETPKADADLPEGWRLCKHSFSVMKDSPYEVIVGNARVEELRTVRKVRSEHQSVFFPWTVEENLQDPTRSTWLFKQTVALQLHCRSDGKCKHS
jgi:hypothetical protein